MQARINVMYCKARARQPFAIFRYCVDTAAYSVNKLLLYKLEH